MRGNGDFRDSAQRKFPNHFLFLCIKIIYTKTKAIVDYWYLFFYLGWFWFYFHMILFCTNSSLTDWLFCTARLKNCWKKWKSHLAHLKAISSPDIDWKSNENVLPNVHLTKVPCSSQSVATHSIWPMGDFSKNWYNSNSNFPGKNNLHNFEKINCIVFCMIGSSVHYIRIQIRKFFLSSKRRKKDCKGLK